MPAAACGAVPHTTSPWTVCAPKGGRLPPAWNVRNASACACVSKTTPWVPETAFQTIVSPELTGTFVAGLPPTTHLTIPPAITPSTSMLAATASRVPAPSRTRAAWTITKKLHRPDTAPGFLIAAPLPACRSCSP